MSAIIQLGEHKFQLPVPPALQEEVLYVKHKKADQYWRRDTDFPAVFFDYIPTTRAHADHTEYDPNTGLLLTLSREDTKIVMDLRDRELYRRIHGVWLMNNGELIWFPGNYYFQLQWGAVKDYINPYDGGKYGEHREFMRNYQYFRQHCLTVRDSFNQRTCAAGVVVKPKKTAITNTEALNFLNESTLFRDKILGMMSKSGDDVELTNFAYYLYGLDELPFIMRPAIANRNLSKVVFGNPTGRPTGSAKSIQQQLDAGKGFNTTVYTRGLIANAFDGPVMFRYWNDEFTKYIDPYPKEVFKKTSEVVKKQESIQGLGMWTAYVAETDGKEFKESKEIMEEALLSTLDKVTNRTKSEFLYWFISADDAGETSFDKYGKANSAKNIQRIEAKRSQLKDDPAALQAFTRQSPRTSEEAWREGGGGGTVFNNMRLGIRKEQIVSDINKGKPPFTVGTLEWDTVRMGLVNFVPTSEDDMLAGKHGRCRFYGWDRFKPEDFNRPLRENIRDENDFLMPDKRDDDGQFIMGNAWSVGATDPTEYAYKSNVKTPSQCASTVMNFHDSARNSLFGEVVTKRFIFRYLYRHESPKDTLEDIIKKIMFFGCYEAIEGNREWMYTMMIEHGLQNFMLVRDPKLRTIVPFNPRQHQELLRTVSAGGTNVIEDYVRAKSMYYAPPKGGEPDYLNLLEDEQQIEQDMAFNTKETKKYDLSVCSSYNIMALESFNNYRILHSGKATRYDTRTLEIMRDRLL